MAVRKAHWFQQKLPYIIKPNSKFLKRNIQDCLSAFSSSPISFGLGWSPCTLVLHNYSLQPAIVVFFFFFKRKRPTTKREEIPPNSPKQFQVRTSIMYVIQCQSKADPTPHNSFTQLLTIHMEVLTQPSWLNLVLL